MNWLSSKIMVNLTDSIKGALWEKLILKDVFIKDFNRTNINLSVHNAQTKLIVENNIYN